MSCLSESINRLCLAALLSANINLNLAWAGDSFAIAMENINPNFLERKNERFSISRVLASNCNDGDKPRFRGLFENVPERHVVSRDCEASRYKQRTYLISEFNGFYGLTGMLKHNRTLSGLNEKFNEPFSLFGGDRPWREPLFQLDCLNPRLLKFGLSSFESGFCFSFVDGLNVIQPIGNEVTTKSDRKPDGSNNKSDPSKYAGQALEFISTHWQLLLSFFALLYSAYVFGYTGAAIRASKARHNVM